MRTAIDKVGRGKERDVNVRFMAMASHYMFEPEFCNPASGWEKGQVEKNVQDARHRFFQPIPRFPSMEALNDWLEERCKEFWAKTPTVSCVAPLPTSGGLSIEDELHTFLIEEALPETGVDAERFFWQFAQIFHDLAPKNRALLAKRDEMQEKLDDWYRRNGAPVDLNAYENFLREIGYLLPVTPD